MFIKMFIETESSGVAKSIFLLSFQFATLVHSFLVMVDGGTIFKEDINLRMDLVKNDTRKSLTSKFDLHEILFDYWD